MFGNKLASLFVEVGVEDRTRLGLNQIRPRLSQYAGTLRNALAIPVTLGGAIAGAAATKFVIDATRAAGDLNETLSKVGVVFGESAGKVTGFADEMASKFGLVKREMMDAASAFGLVLQGSGLTADASADLSVKLAKLAADAASFYNVPVAEALEKIRSGLVGEAEPLRAFGVLLSEGAVKSKAAAMGFKELDEAAKAAARAQIIIEGLTKASGDLARTSDSLANRQRSLAGQWQNFQADMGAMLTGPAADMLSTFSQILRVVEDTFDPSRPKAFGEAMTNSAGQGLTWGMLGDMILAGPGGGKVARQRLVDRMGAPGYDPGRVAAEGVGTFKTPAERDAYLRALGINNPSTAGPTVGFGPGAMNPAQQMQMLAPGLAVAAALMFPGQGDMSSRTLRRSNEIDAYDEVGTRLSREESRLASMERSRRDRLATGGVMGDQLSAVSALQNELLNDLPKQQLEEQKKMVTELREIKEALGKGTPFALERSAFVLRGPE